MTKIQCTDPEDSCTSPATHFVVLHYFSGAQGVWPVCNDHSDAWLDDYLCGSLTEAKTVVIEPFVN